MLVNINLYLTFPSLLVSCFYVLIRFTLCYTAFNYCVTFMFQLHMTDETAARMYPQALGIYGNWLADTRSENPNIIMEEYLEKVGQCYIFVVNSFVKHFYKHTSHVSLLTVQLTIFETENHKVNFLYATEK